MKRSNGKYRLSAKDAISNAQEQYTRCAAVCPGTFTPVQGDLKVVKAGLQGQRGRRVPRGRQPGRFKSRESGVARGSRPLAGARGVLAKTLFSCFSCVAAGDTRKTGSER